MSILEKIEANRKNINPFYDMRTSELKELCNANTRFDIAHNAFCYGYIKGVRAAKAEAKAKEKKA